MRPKFEYILLFFCLILNSCTYAPITSGVITYRGVMNEDHVESFLKDLEEKDIPLEVKQGVVEMYHNATPDEYFLNIRDGESYYYHNLSSEQTENFNLGSKAGRNSFYCNSSTYIAIEDSPSLGRIANHPLEWEITRNKKTIGGYECFQAVATEKIYSRRGYHYNKNIVAWFSPQIPMKFGPKNYNSLPGLILEIQTDTYTLTATEILLNPQGNRAQIVKLDDNVTIITREVANKRIQEMEEDRKNKR